MASHPYIEKAEVIEDVLRAQREHDRRNDGVTLFASEHEQSAYRHEAAELRRLARIDLDNETYPVPDDD